MANNIPKKVLKKTNRNVSQVLTPQMGHYIERDLNTGLFTATKQDGKPFEEVTIEKGNSLPSHLKLSKALANKI